MSREELITLHAVLGSRIWVEEEKEMEKLKDQTIVSRKIH